MANRFDRLEVVAVCNESVTGLGEIVGLHSRGGVQTAKIVIPYGEEGKLAPLEGKNIDTVVTLGDDGLPVNVLKPTYGAKLGIKVVAEST